MPPAVIAGGIAAVGTIGGALLSSSAQKKAANNANEAQQGATAAQLQLGQQSLALNKDIYNANYNTLSPYVARGNVAGDSLNALLGLPAAPAMTSPLAAPNGGSYSAPGGGLGSASPPFTQAQINAMWNDGIPGNAEAAQAQLDAWNAAQSQAAPQPTPATAPAPAPTPAPAPAPTGLSMAALSAPVAATSAPTGISTNVPAMNGGVLGSGGNPGVGLGSEAGIVGGPGSPVSGNTPVNSGGGYFGNGGAGINPGYAGPGTGGTIIPGVNAPPATTPTPAAPGAPPAATPQAATPAPAAVTPISAQTAMQNFANSAGMQFQLEQGQNMIEHSAASRGALQSGAALKALQDYGQQTALNNYFMPYMGLLGNQQAVGAGSASSIAGVGANFGNTAAGINGQMGGAIQGGANSASANAIAAGNSNAGMWNSIGGAVGNFASTIPLGSTSTSYTPMSQADMVNGINGLGY